MEEAEPPLHNITKHCMRHVTNALAPGILNQTYLVAKVTTFCGELAAAANPKGKSKRNSSAETPFVQSVDISRFVEGAIAPLDFCNLLEQAMLRDEDGKIDNAAVQGICYKYYNNEKKGDITYPKWFSPTCTYRLWMVFCVLVEDDFLTITKESIVDVLKRLLELSGYNWTDEPEDVLGENERFDFPQFLDTITLCFEKFKLESSLTCEVIEDLHDEYVCGVQKKGYLVKKGHVRKNYKKRWFVLQRTNMSYYESRKNMDKKGEFALNGNTVIRSIQDEGEKKYRFLVSCGETGKVFELFAEDQRSKQQWITAISKAIALAKVLEQDGESSVKAFYNIKYGTDDPRLMREDSELRRIRYLTNKRKEPIKRDSEASAGEPVTSNMSRVSSQGTDLSTGSIELAEDEENDEGEEDEYLSMEPLRSISVTTEDEDLEVYVPMRETASVVTSLQMTGPREPTSPSAVAPQPTTPTADKSPLASGGGRPLQLITDDRGYTYLDTLVIAGILKDIGGDGNQGVGPSDPNAAANDLYMEPRFFSPTENPLPDVAGGQGNSVVNEDSEDVDDVYEEPSFVFQPPNQGTKIVEQEVVKGMGPNTASSAAMENIYMDASLLMTMDNRGEMTEVEAGVGNGVYESYDSWNILANTKSSSVLSNLSPQRTAGPQKKALNHLNIKMLAAGEDRDSSSPEDMEQWKMPTGGSIQNLPSDLVLSPTGLTKTTKPQVQTPNQPAACEEDMNYNYVSWEFVNQPNADDVSGRGASLNNTTPTDETTNNYLKISHMSPSHDPPSSNGAPVHLKSPLTDASFYLGGELPGTPSAATNPSKAASDNPHLYVNLDDISMPMGTPDTPPVPSRGKRASKPDLSSDIGPVPPPRTATTTGTSRGASNTKKPLPNPRQSVLSQEYQ